MKKPIQSQKEGDEVFTNLVNTAMERFGIERKQAEKRIKSLLDSGELNNLHPASNHFKMVVDMYMCTEVD